MPVLTALDWVILGVVALSAIMSLFRGFIKEASSIFSWVASFIISSRFYPEVASFLTFSQDLLTRKAIASIILFISSLLILGFITSLIGTLLKKAGLSGFDRVLGVAFGIARGVLIASAVLALVQILSKLHILSFVQDYYWYRDSVFIPELQRIVNWFFIYMGTPQNGA